MDAAGLSFGAEAAAYERGRPEWPEELLEALPLGPGAEVVDVGAGTGKLTRLLARRYARVVAVEPDGRLRELIPAGEAAAGSAEALPLADASVDGAFAAEAFHWFDHARAVPELARVLRPGGVLAVLLNRFDPAYDVLPADLATGSSPKPVDVAAVLAGAPFGELHTVEVGVRREQTREELLDFFASISPVTALPPAARADWLRRLAEALDRPTYPRAWTARLQWAARR